MSIKDRKQIEDLCKKLHWLKFNHKLEGLAKNPAFKPYKIGRPPEDAIRQRTKTPKIFRILYANSQQPKYAFRVVICEEKTYLVYSDYETALFALNNYKKAIPKGYNAEINTLSRILAEKIKCATR
jgi:hypothetical protein